MVLGHDLIQRFSKERFQLFLTGLMAMYSGAGVLLPLGVYKWVLRSPWFLAIAAVCAAQCVVLGAALHLARRSRHQQAITLVCIGNWAAVCSSRSSRRTCCRLWCSRRWCPSFSPSSCPTSAGSEGWLSP